MLGGVEVTEANCQERLQQLKDEAEQVQWGKAVWPHIGALLINKTQIGSCSLRTSMSMSIIALDKYEHIFYNL